MNVDKFIQRLKESESYKKFKDEIDEMSTTGMVAGYETPKAFSPQSGEGKAEFDAQTKDNAEQFGYKIVPKQKRRNSISYDELVKQESVSKKQKLVKEASTTAGFAQMNIGDAFIDYEGDEDDKANVPHKTMKKTSEISGYKIVGETMKKDNESAYKQAMRILHEASYKEYRGDKTRTTSEKINYSIKELNQALLQVERAVGHALRLKTEMGVDQRTFWRSSQNRLTKIGERLNRIGKKINELGA